MQVGNVNYGGGNPMRPHRVRLTHTLVDTYGLKNNMSVHRPQHASQSELASFHADGEQDQLGKYQAGSAALLRLCQ